MPVYNQPNKPTRQPRQRMQTPEHIKEADRKREALNKDFFKALLAPGIKALEEYEKKPFRMPYGEFQKYVPLFQKENVAELSPSQLHYLREEYYRIVGRHRNLEVYDHTDPQKKTLFVIGKAMSTLKLMPHSRDIDVLRTVNFKKDNFDPTDVMVARTESVYAGAVRSLRDASAEHIATDIVKTHLLNKQIAGLKTGADVSTLGNAASSPGQSAQPVAYDVGIGEIEE